MGVEFAKSLHDRVIECFHRNKEHGENPKRIYEAMIEKGVNNRCPEGDHGNNKRQQADKRSFVEKVSQLIDHNKTP